jgi:hypothetical protein
MISVRIVNLVVKLIAVVFIIATYQLIVMKRVRISGINNNCLDTGCLLVNRAQ